MKRVLSAAVLLPLVLIVFILGNTYVVDVFMGIVALRCIYELFHAFEQKGHHPVRWVGYLAAIATVYVPILFAASPFAAILSAPTHTISIIPFFIKYEHIPSVIKVTGIPSIVSSRVVILAPC